jgi:hypothetical protein
MINQSGTRRARRSRSKDDALSRRRPPRTKAAAMDGAMDYFGEISTRSPS